MWCVIITDIINKVGPHITVSRHHRNQALLWPSAVEIVEAWFTAGLKQGRKKKEDILEKKLEQREWERGEEHGTEIAFDKLKCNVVVFRKKEREELNSEKEGHVSLPRWKILIWLTGIVMIMLLKYSNVIDLQTSSLMIMVKTISLLLGWTKEIDIFCWFK